jgi:Peptidase M50B-like
VLNLPSVTQIPDTLSGAAAALIGLVALAVVAPIAGWQFIRHGTVMAHEGAHAVFGSLAGRKISGIALNPDATGGTLVGPGGCLGSIIVGFAGYVGPSLFGLGAAWAIHLGHSGSVLWVALFLLVMLAFMLRRSYGMITVVFVGALVYLVGHYLPQGAQIVAAYFLTWLLLLSGVRRVLEVGPQSSDGANLSQLTMIPRLIWWLIWLAATLGAVALGGKMLVMPS